jgi:hypothetical protein
MCFALSLSVERGPWPMAGAAARLAALRGLAADRGPAGALEAAGARAEAPDDAGSLANLSRSACQLHIACLSFAGCPIAVVRPSCSGRHCAAAGIGLARAAAAGSARGAACGGVQHATCLATAARGHQCRRNL